MRKGFTFLELVFVIVVIGILARFGSNILMTTYTSYLQSTTTNRIQANTELTLKQISNRLQYRIRGSVISRAALNGAFTPVTGAALGDTVLEWISYDIDGWNGTWNGVWNAPNWSGFIDVNNANAMASNQFPLPALPLRPFLESPGTNTGLVNATINAVSATGATGIGNAAIFFTGANVNVMNDYGYNGAENYQVYAAAHPITNAGTNFATQLADATTLPAGALPPDIDPNLNAGVDPSSFRNTDIYENYKLAWTAYAISFEDGDGDGTIDDLVLYYDYQPWNGGVAGANRILLLQNANSFAYRAIGDTLRIQICTDEQGIITGAAPAALCQEITVF